MLELVSSCIWGSRLLDPHISASKTLYTWGLATTLENTMHDLATTLCRGITRQVLATVPLRARLNGRPVVAGLPVPTDDLIPVAGGPS